MLLAAAGSAALLGAAGLALAQEGGHPRGPHGLFQADANNDGVLTRQEFDAGRDSMFARLDANSDDQLSADERRAHHRGHGRRGGGMHGLRGADANNDGAITRDEFLARPLAHFERLDGNDDGVISADERPQRRERGEHGRRGDRTNPDANGDGQISRAEFAAMSAPMFERLDANDDGRLTGDEMRRPHRHGRE
jgi:hypothetical protein